jgi:NAD(P)-dependent dehydrogenase (short-subunit alcohol dehydrogenase family)
MRSAYNNQVMQMRKKVLLLGATGMLGRVVANALSEGADVIEVGCTRGSHRVDITDSKDLRAMFERLGKVDAIVSTAGKVHYGLVTDTTAEQFMVGLRNKLLGQIDLALTGQPYLNDSGSITLTSGIVSEHFIRMGTNMAVVNRGLEAFAAAAAGELVRGQRINVVSPTMISESVSSYGPFFAGYEPVAGARVAQAYVRSIEGIESGKVYKVWS